MYRLFLVLLVSVALVLGLGVAFAFGGLDLNLEDIAVVVVGDSGTYTGPSETETETETINQNSNVNITGPSTCQNTFIWGVSQDNLIYQFAAQGTGDQDAESDDASGGGGVGPISAALAMGGINGNLAMSYQDQTIIAPQNNDANMFTVVEVELEKTEIELEDISLEDVSIGSRIRRGHRCH
ncbi:hypothetical protein QBE54_04325 [Thermatribacter velox]|uniref:Uncharacterized protein n=1 Tax=Thermatribacter velox TaxID=3039681 RepID=A0ABZ2YFB9_9BACT